MHFVGLLYRLTADEGELADEVANTTDRCEWIPLGELRGFPLVPLAVFAADLLDHRRTSDEA